MVKRATLQSVTRPHDIGNIDLHKALETMYRHLPPTITLTALIKAAFRVSKSTEVVLGLCTRVIELSGIHESDKVMLQLLLETYGPELIDALRPRRRFLCCA